MLPANQGLHTHQLTAAHVDNGLVVQHKFLRRQGLANAVQGFVVAAYQTVLFGIENVVPVAARHLGLVHGLVGLAQQLAAAHFFALRKKCHAQTGGDLEHDIV